MNLCKKTCGHGAIMLSNNIIDFEKLEQLGKSQASAYQTASPYPHFVGDDIFKEEVLDTILEEFEVSEKNFFSFDTKYEKKLQMNKEEHFGPMRSTFFIN